MNGLGTGEMRRERRKHFRVEWHSVATIFHGKLARPCILSNFSNGGAKITGVRAATFPNKFGLRIAPNGRIHKCRVLWRSDDTLRVEFIDRIASTQESGRVNKVLQPA
jgi:hypothetical protein